jgi:hypothetical protein
MYTEPWRWTLQTKGDQRPGKENQLRGELSPNSRVPDLEGCGELYILSLHFRVQMLYHKLAGVCLFSFVNAPWTGIMFFRQVE